MINTLFENLKVIWANVGIIRDYFRHAHEKKEKRVNGEGIFEKNKKGC